MSLSFVNISSCHLLFVCSFIRRFPSIIFPLCSSRFALAIPDSVEKHLFPRVALLFSSPSSHLSLSFSFSPPPSLVPLLLTLCPSICAAQRCYRNQSIWNRREGKKILASSPISLHSRPPVLISCSIYTVDFICANRYWSYCCHNYCGNIDIILHTVTMATSRALC